MLHVICSGSLGEGVEYPTSDDDIMYVDKRQHWYVYNSYWEAIQYRALFMKPSEYSPGNCLVFLTDCEIIGQKTPLPLLSSTYRDHFVQIIDRTVHHGPAAYFKIGQFETDNVYSLACPQWPVLAYEWILRRRRYGWPSRELIEENLKNGCYIVPVGNPDSPLCDFEWRLSFNTTERSLIYSFNHVQFIVYNLLKLILKRVIEIRHPNILCSYFIKTVMFYVVENTDPGLWTMDAVEECYRKCLFLLYHFISSMNCPNYFIPENNMMRRKVKSFNRVPLMIIVADLMTCGIVGSLHLCCAIESFVLSPLLLHISPGLIELLDDSSLLCGHLCKFVLIDSATFIDLKIYRGYFYGLGLKLRKTIASVLSTFGHVQISANSDSSFLNVILKETFSKIGTRCIQVANGITEGNRFSYQVYRYGQAMLRMGRNSDVSSGRLQLACYMFMTGKFHQCLVTINAVLSDFAPFVAKTREVGDFAFSFMYIETICNQNYSLDYKVRRAWALEVRFSKLSASLAPLPIRILLNEVGLELPFHPLVFIYLLQGLCFYHTRDMSSMNTSVCLLEDTERIAVSLFI